MKKIKEWKIWGETFKEDRKVLSWGLIFLIAVLVWGIIDSLLA